MVPRRWFLVTFGNPLTLGFTGIQWSASVFPLITVVITWLLLWNHDQFKLFIRCFDFVVEKLRISVLCCDNKACLLIKATSFIMRRKTLHESHKIGPRHISTALWGALGLSEQTISLFHKLFSISPMWFDVRVFTLQLSAVKVQLSYISHLKEEELLSSLIQTKKWQAH